MRLCRRRPLVIALYPVIVLALGVAAWRIAWPHEPAYGGKPLSVWLDELAAMDYSHRTDPHTAQVRALRSIGTAAIPWLMSEFQGKADQRRSRINYLISQPHVIKWRIPERKRCPLRGVVGFEALGELGSPAIPSLLDLLEDNPGPVPLALAGIGAPALPALGRCITNTTSYGTFGGQVIPIPPIAIGALSNAIRAGRISASDVTFLLPAIRAWDQPTNQNSTQYAASVLRKYTQ